MHALEKKLDFITIDATVSSVRFFCVEGRRTLWKPRLVPVSIKKLTFLDQEIFANGSPVMASCSHVEGINYHWKRGVREHLARVG